MAYWRLDESTGATMVDSYNLNNGVYSGAVTQGTPGLIPVAPILQLRLTVGRPSMARLQCHSMGVSIRARSPWNSGRTH